MLARMKEILLDLVEVTRGEVGGLDDQLVDFGVVGPGPRRILNWINGSLTEPHGQHATNTTPLIHAGREPALLRT